MSSRQKKFSVSYQVIHQRNESVLCEHEPRQSSQTSQPTAKNKLTSHQGLEKVKISCARDGVHHVHISVPWASFSPSEDKSTSAIERTFLLPPHPLGV